MSNGVSEFDKSKLFGVSTRLIAGCSAINKAMMAEQLNNEERESLRYAGHLWGAVDWGDDGTIRRTEFDAVLATTLRPLFYEAITEGKIAALARGSDRNRVYDSFISGNPGNLTVEALDGSRRVLNFMQREIFSYLTQGQGEV